MYDNIDYTNKKDKWTIMKYVSSFDLLLQYVELIKDLHYFVDDKHIDIINKKMQENRIYNPRDRNRPSKDTQYFKIIQICNNMFAYRGKDKKIVFTPLCNLLLKNKDDIEKRGKIVATMLANLPYNHPYNKMSASFNIFPYRLIYKLLMDTRLNNKLYLDEVFYLVAWTKEVDIDVYEELICRILELRKTPYEQKYEMFTKRLPIQDCLANMLHETRYLFEQLEGAGIVELEEGEKVGILCHGGFGRDTIPETLKGISRKYRPTGKRKYTKSYISLKPYLKNYMKKLLSVCDFLEKPHSIYEELGTDDYILKLWNFLPQILLKEIGVSEEKRLKITYIYNVTENIKTFSLNSKNGDYRNFEKTICSAFNEFCDVDAKLIANPGTVDIECIYLTINEKFDVEAKSTSTKLTEISAGRLNSHRDKIGSKYTIIITPKYVPAVIEDIKNTDNVLLTVNSFCNFLYQTFIDTNEVSYEPIYNIIMSNKGKDISSLLNDFVSSKYGIGEKE